MRWYSIVSLFSNSRVRLLFVFIIIAIIIAIILILVEISLKKEKIRRAKRAANSAPVDEMREFLKGHDTLKNKLDFADKTAKEYFGRMYGTSVSSGYSMLIDKFEKDKMKEELVFCKEMFDSYYSDKELTNDRVKILGGLLADVMNKKDVSRESLRLPSIFEKIVEFISERLEAAKQKRRSDENRRKKVMVASRREIKDWVGKAIGADYPREEVLNLLDDGKRSSRETGRVLNVFDKEMFKLKKRNVKKFKKKRSLSSVDDGIASRIVMKGKNLS